MSDQTVFGISTRGTSATMLVLDKKDRVILRELACQVADLAARPIEEEKRHLWYRHNALEATRPLVFLRPREWLE